MINLNSISVSFEDQQGQKSAKQQMAYSTIVARATNIRGYWCLRKKTVPIQITQTKQSKIIQTKPVILFCQISQVMFIDLKRREVEKQIEAKKFIDEFGAAAFEAREKLL